MKWYRPTGICKVILWLFVCNKSRPACWF